MESLFILLKICFSTNLVTFLHIADLFSSGRIDCWENFSTHRVSEFIVDEDLDEQNKAKEGWNINKNPVKAGFLLKEGNKMRLKWRNTNFSSLPVFVCTYSTEVIFVEQCLGPSLRLEHVIRIVRMYVYTYRESCLSQHFHMVEE